MEYKYLKIFKASMFGIGTGILIFIFSFFVSAANGGYFYTATGVGIVIASLITLMFGMSISLMEEVTDAEIRNKETNLYFVPRKPIR
ncbi:hypothetical protein BIV60_14420 [Bacillus sp. MUM 116]|uniref:hypothetical protein n=1 Tax=Bacillus sp. MUM 116 TaxID=1678002 RepID=UPI0008F5F70E|nr:hypothetical protein [Bacillus sp. MUM 116]OIK13278.1 hypothetical protein BIV60_14420 [Bacillus sp. MUM 116]